MNILLVTETYLPFISGVSTSSDSIARFMVSHGHTVTVVAPQPILPGEAPPLTGLSVVRTSSIPDVIYKGKPMTVFPIGFPVILNLLRGQHFDVVHIQEPGSLGISALMAAKLKGVPTIGALHFTPDQMSRMVTGKSHTIIRTFAERYIQFIYNRYSAIMVPTQTFSDFLHTLGVRKKIRVVSNGVDTTLYTPPREKGALRNKRADSGTMFLYIGRIDEDKNVKTLVLAMQYTSSEVKLTIAGNGKQKESLMKLAKTLHADHKIIWKGSITEAQMIRLYRQADCFTIMAEFEIQSIVTLQALAIGLPVVGANAGALPELIHDGKNGYLVETHDAKMLGDKMNYLAAHPEIRRKMGEESRRLSLAHHKPTVLARLEDLYKEVTRSQGKRNSTI